MPDQYVARVVDLTDPAAQRIPNMSIEEARERVASGDPGRVREIDGSFSIVARVGRRVRLARSLDRPLRYFLAKEAAGPALIVSDRIDAIHAFLEKEGLAGQFHPSYTRMVPAHYVVDLELIGCPDPSPTYARYFTPARAAFSAEPAAIGSEYVGALCGEIARWLEAVPAREPIGVAFSGGIDSGAVLLVAYHVMRRRGLGPRAPEGVHPLGRRRRGPRAGADLSRERSGSDCFSSRSRSRPALSIPLEAVRRHRGLQAARRRVGDDGARALPRHSRALPATGASCSTATAATRT